MCASGEVLDPVCVSGIKFAEIDGAIWGAFDFPLNSLVIFFLIPLSRSMSQAANHLNPKNLPIGVTVYFVS